jgi:hypothetical protein
VIEQGILGKDVIEVAASPEESAVASPLAGVAEVAASAAEIEEASPPVLRYDSPQAIYQRYIAAKEAWFKAQPRGSIRTNQPYRKAIGLPQRYDKASYKWCLDWKQMTRYCQTPKGTREWTKEEMMAYLDWSNAEDERVYNQVDVEMQSKPQLSRRGVADI